MSNDALKVADGLVVSLEYVLKLDGGEEVDSSGSEGPLEFLQGHGHIIPGLEQALYGMDIGAEKEVVVAPADAYGEHDPESFERMPRSAFPPEIELEEGLELFLQDSESGAELEATVAELQEDGVILDFNHPLAGETLHFSVKVADLRPATAEELEHGHVHGDDHHHH